MLTRETSSVMRVLSPEGGGAALWFLDWPERSSASAQRTTTRYSFFMSGESIIGRGRSGWLLVVGGWWRLFGAADLRPRAVLSGLDARDRESGLLENQGG